MFKIVAWAILIFGGIFLGLYLDTLLFSQVAKGLIIHLTSALIGLMLLYFVIRVSKNTGRTLAKFGRTGSLKRIDTNIFVSQGVYKHMRHPMHLGLLFFPLSIALIVGSPSFIIIIAPTEILFILMMIKFVEEPESVRKFGKQYLDYKKQTPWFCFKVECLKNLLKSYPKN